MAWHATFQACVFFELSPRLFSAAMMAGNFVLPSNENWDSHATSPLQKLSLPEKHKLSWGPTEKRASRAMYFSVNSMSRVWLAMKANRNGAKKSLLRLLASQVYSLVLCSFLEVRDWANTLQFDFLLQFCPTFTGCWAGLLAANARLIWEALTLFSYSTRELNTHEPVPSSSKSSL